MPLHRKIPTGWLVLGLILVPSTVPAREWKGHAEITLYGGGSLLDLERTRPDRRFGPMPEGAQGESVVWPSFIQFRRSLGGSLMVGLKVGYHVTDYLAVESNFSLAPKHTLKESLHVACDPGEICPMEIGFLPEYERKENITAYAYDINLVYHFSRSRVRPYWTAGIGGVSYDVPDDFETNFTFNTGLGLKIYGRRLGLRFEINEHVIPDHFLTGKTASNLQFQAGLVFQPNL